MAYKGKGHLGGFFTSRKQKGIAGLPLLSVTIHDGLVLREEIERRTETNISPEKHLLVKKGDIAYNMMRMWQGALGRSKYEGIVSPAYVVLSPNSTIDSQYAEYLFNTQRMMYLFWAYSYGLTKDRLRLYFNDFRKIPVNVLALPEQKKVAKIISTWDKAITTTEQLIANSQQHKKVIMQQLLTGKKRLVGFSGEWMKVRLGDIAVINSGGTPKSLVTEYYDGSIPWVSIADMTNYGKVIDRTKRNITKLGLDNSSARLYPKGTVLYAMYASIGECSIAGVELSSSQAILGIKPKNILDNFYLYFYLSSLKEKVKLLGQQGTQANLNAGMVKGFRFSLPTIKEQQKIAQVLSSADQEIETLQQKLNFLKQEKKALMQQLLTGKRRVMR